MATGRTHLRYVRVYADGYDLSGYTRQIGPLEIEFAADAMAALTDEVKNVLPDHASIGVGELNGFFDNTATSGLHAAASGAGVKRTLLVAIGIRGAPAQGDPAWMGQFEQLGYHAVPEDGYVVANIPFGMHAFDGATLLYDKVWGTLLAPLAARTAVNSAVGVDDNGAATTRGGLMCYQLLSSNGTVTLKTQDAATNADGSFADITGATSGSINASVTPAAGIVALGNTATVRRYIRWQLAFGTATTASFCLAFVRG